MATDDLYESLKPAQVSGDDLYASLSRADDAPVSDDLYESVKPTTSSASLSQDAGYDYSRHRTPSMQGDIPQRTLTIEEKEAKRGEPEYHSLPEDAVMDFFHGVANATRGNVGWTGKFSEWAANSVVKSYMQDEQAKTMGYESVDDYLLKTNAARKAALLEDVTESQKLVASLIDPVSLAATVIGGGPLVQSGKAVAVRVGAEKAIRAASSGTKAAKAVAAQRAITAADKAAKAEDLARLLKLGAAGSSYAGTYEALDQLTTDGKITDPLAIAGWTVAGGVVPPALDKSLRLFAKGLDRAAVRSLERYTMQALDEKFGGAATGGLNPRAAFNESMERLGLSDGVVNDIIDGNGLREQYTGTVARWMKGLPTKRDLSSHTYVDMEKVKNGILASTKNRFKGAMDATADFVDGFIEPISSSIRKINVPVLSGLRRADFQTNLDSNAWRSVIEPAAQVYQDLPKNLKYAFTKAVYNGDTKMAAKIFKDAAGDSGERAYLSVRSVLDDIFEKYQGVDVDINYLSNHWPRYIKSGQHDAMIEHMGWKPTTFWDRLVKQKELTKGLRSDVESAIAKQEKELNRELTPEEVRVLKEQVGMLERRKIELTEKEKDDLLNSYFKGITPQGLKTPTAAKQRVIERVSDDMLPFYEDPFKNLFSYIDHAAHTINTRKFFGKHLVDDELNADVRPAIGSLVRELEANHEIRTKDFQKLQKLIEARYGYTHAGEYQNIKNVFYATQLGQFDSALTQIGDLGTAAYVNGLANTIRGLWGVPGDILDQVGIKKIGHEFESTAGTAKLVDKAFKFSGFRAIDRLGKFTHLGGALQKNRVAVSDAKSLQKFRAKWTPFFGEETDSLIRDLQTGRISDNVKFLLYNELSDVQPISLLEVPKKYLEVPGGRMFYAMKTFMIKQIDLVRRDIFSKLKNGTGKERVEAMKNAIWYSMAVGSMNLTAENAKAFVTGREMNWTDLEFSLLLKNFGLSQYWLDKMGEHLDSRKITDNKMTRVISEMLLLSNPATGMLEVGERLVGDVIGNLKHFGSRFESLQDIPAAKIPPGGGSILYYLFGGGLEKLAKQEERKRAEKEREELGYDEDELEDDYESYK